MNEAKPQILVNGEDQELQQHQEEQEEQEEEEEQVSSSGPVQECSEDSKEKQAKMQSVFQQVRNQIRSQVGMKAPKSSILELMQRVKDGELKIAQVNPEENKQADEMHVKQEELRGALEEKLEASKKALRDEFEVQISRVRAEMQAYTDQALKDLECKMQKPHLKEQQEVKGPDKKQKPSAPPSLASRRGRVLTRTMTTIIPKTSAPVIVGPRAKSETLSSSKAESSRPLLRDPGLSLLCQTCCKPLLPPAYVPLHQRKKPARPKPKAGN